MAITEWGRGDTYGLEIPAHGAALESGGADFLTRAFRVSGALKDGESVRRIVSAEPFQGGGTGSKMRLTVEYHAPSVSLPCDLFIKFSRNFEDPARDRENVRHMMHPEIKLAQLSMGAGFPIRVPTCLFADFEAASGTGLLITEQVQYGRDGIEPHYPKCLDEVVPEPLARYRAIMTALGALAGAHRAGQLPGDVQHEFPFHLASAVTRDPIVYSREQLERRATRIAAFVQRHARLFPDNVADPEFLDRFVREVPQVSDRSEALKQHLLSRPACIALCHWNANIDNAWFWRDSDGRLQCGLMDWGLVGQMNVAQAIYGAFSGADVDLWNGHLDDVLAAFLDSFVRHGGEPLPVDELRNDTVLYASLMGLAYLMDAPAILEATVPDIEQAHSPRDACFRDHEDARVVLHMLTMFLNLWQTRTIGQRVAALFAETTREPA